jgi:4-hydroxybutyrate CoA-transferase
LYDWLPQAQGLRLVGCAGTYDRDALAKLDRFVAVNSALEVDLLGQCNLEHMAGRTISSAGGAPDFAGAARACRGGLSVVALNATFGKEAQSRIVPTLSRGAVVSLSRLDVDVVVTEFGVADLRDASVHERARALIAVAAPQFREDLARSWAEQAATL